MVILQNSIGSSLGEKIRQVGSQVGNTPMHHITSLYNRDGVGIYAKKEWKQLGGSVKARAAYAIIRSAIESNALTEDRILLDATSGNTGIAYASNAREVGLRVTLCLPENASAERKEILKRLGVEIIFTSKFDGTDGAQQIARQLAKDQPDKYFYADQYKNDNNWKAHFNTTAKEIFNALPGVTHFVAGLGTTGTFVGTGRGLRSLNPSIRLIGLQPDSALHGLEGWKHLDTAVTPGIYDPDLADKILEVTTEEAYAIIKLAREKEGLLLSPSSAANLAGAIKTAKETESATIVTVLPDNADKYAEVISRLL